MAEEPENRVNEVLERVPWYAVPAVLLGVPALAAILSALFPSFYHDVVWKYYWGPIVADGSEVDVMVRGGVAAESGYNIVNTISWALLLFVCVLGIAQLLHRFRVPMDTRMILAATAWVVTGSVWHVLQDAQLFRQPLEFFFITPPVWLLFGAGGIASMVLGVYFRYVQEETGSLERALQKVWFLFSIFVLAYTFLWIAGWSQVAVYLNPVYLAIHALIAYLAVRIVARRAGGIEPWQCVATFSIGWFLVGLHYYGLYLTDPWPGRFPDDALRFGIWFIPLLATAVTGAVYLVARWLRARGSENAWAFMRPINLVLVWSHMLDAFSTSVGVDRGTYGEKHLLSESVRLWSQRLYETVGWEWGAANPTFMGFAPIKLLVALLVVYAIDIASEEDAQKHPIMINLVKFAIIMVGIGPGVRNTLRMTLGI